jgi:type IV secretory pathway VirB2 component (pilin)
MYGPTLPALLIGDVLSGPLGQLFAVIVVVGVVVLVGRIVLRIAWRLVTIAAVVVGLLLLATMFLPDVL